MNMESVRYSLNHLWINHKTECIAISVALLCGIISLGVFLAPALPRASEATIEIHQPQSESTRQRIVVHIDGAVTHPGVYELDSQSRVQDLVKRAGGFTVDADHAHIAEQINLSKLLADEQKIYIPFQSSTASAPAQNTSTTVSLISINTASLEGLDSLPGVGSVTAKKIMDARPYSSLEQLLQQKIIPLSTYEKIKDRIEL